MNRLETCRFRIEVLNSPKVLKLKGVIACTKLLSDGVQSHKSELLAPENFVKYWLGPLSARLALAHFKEPHKVHLRSHLLTIWDDICISLSRAQISFDYFYLIP